ncbi:Leukotriene A-4 hydrolase [Blomia tropicalis]|nr:Leukotriene A-4 hydrolase [Blomia tropicalis]
MSDVEALSNELKANPIDPNSFARADQAKVNHHHLSLSVDFDHQQLVGNVRLTVNKVSTNVSKLMLDTYELDIQKVQLINDQGQISGKLNHKLFPMVPEFGSKLEVDISSIKSFQFVIQVDYKTATTARALQWLKPEQTEGGVYPYMFSQCQAINARSMVPCQDTPSVKSTYTAEIEAPKFATVLMSAKITSEPTQSTKNSEWNVHHFNQSVPIPSYLIAIVSGQLVSRQLGPRSHVWSEPGLIERSAWEFEGVENILQIAEQLAGPYVFEVYDLLVLPPSFPFGGMENPCLTFVTPTLLAGDRSLVYVVAHEISHSWTGNLVTNQNFEHFWLNEGFTTFLERKIIGRMGAGEAARQFGALEGLKDLRQTIEAMGVQNQLTQMVTDLRGINPDDAFSVVPYEKGHTFLFYLEQLLGGPDVFNPFLKAYIDNFKYQSINTEQFKKFLINYFFENGSAEHNKLLTEVDWNRWLKTPGYPLITPQYNTSLLDVCVELANRWITTNDEMFRNDGGANLFPLDEFKRLDSGQKKLFLIELDERTELKRMSNFKMEQLTNLYQLRTERNSEVRYSWLVLSLKSYWNGALNETKEFVHEIGRLKYIRPIYRAMYQWPETKQFALDLFAANKDRMMSLCVAAISSELGLKN